MGSAFCCFAGSITTDICASCYGNAFAAQGTEYHNTTYCTQSNDTCSDCGGTWCIGNVPVDNEHDPEGDGNGLLQVADTADQDHSFVAEANNGIASSVASGAFCCFSGSSDDDVCGTCYGNAFGAQGEKYHNSTLCTQSNETCSSCNGTWCVGALPVKVTDVPENGRHRRRNHHHHATSGAVP
mmetsp:Transcript_87645/g.281275  ORF Transcript_87645/g.281275 Transcript_87645/m.281275 type:complete len:183 (-) Transcript_87645:96-644(-)